MQERVYVYRHHSGVSKAEGAWSGRASHIYDTSRFQMIVSVLPIALSDQGRYRLRIVKVKVLTSLSGKMVLEGN